MPSFTTVRIMSVTSSAVFFDTERPSDFHATFLPPLLTRKCGVTILPSFAMDPMAFTIWSRGIARDCPNDMEPRLAPSYWFSCLTMPFTSPG